MRDFQTYPSSISLHFMVLDKLISRQERDKCRFIVTYQLDLKEYPDILNSIIKIRKYICKTSFFLLFPVALQNFVGFSFFHKIMPDFCIPSILHTNYYPRDLCDIHEITIHIFLGFSLVFFSNLLNSKPFSCNPSSQ